MGLLKCGCVHLNRFVEVFPDAGNILIELQVTCSRTFIFLRTNPRFTWWRAAFLFPRHGQPSTTVLGAPETFPFCKYKNKSHLIVQFKPGTFYVFLTSQTSLLFDKCTEVRNTHTHTRTETKFNKAWDQRPCFFKIRLYADVFFLYVKFTSPQQNMTIKDVHSQRRGEEWMLSAAQIDGNQGLNWLEQSSAK